MLVLDHHLECSVSLSGTQRPSLPNKYSHLDRHTTLTMPKYGEQPKIGFAYNSQTDHPVNLSGIQLLKLVENSIPKLG